LHQAQSTIGTEIDAKKEVIAAAAVWPVLGKAEMVHVASGQKILSYEPETSNREELIKLATGRSGNLRAPTLKIGNDVYVGFNASLYEKIVR